MNIKYKSKELFVENVSVKNLAENIGTPFYVYSSEEIKNNFLKVHNAVKRIDHIVCYSVKSNSSRAVLSALAKMGCGADIVSGGELYRSLKSGMKPEKIVFSGVGKTAEEIDYALKSGILMFNVESMEELRAISRIANRLKRTASVAVRINPDVEVDTHHHITTGKAENKFGVNYHHSVRAYLIASRLPNIRVLGIQMHIGSQIKETAPYVKGAKKLMEVVDSLAALGIRIKFIDIGGGFGIAYARKEKYFPVGDLYRKIAPLVKSRDLTLIAEPGRFISGSSGLLVTKVLYCKYMNHKNFIIVDAGMNDLIRPSLYSAHHDIVPAVKNKRKTIIADVVGPICESGDFFAKGRHLHRYNSGEYMAVKDAGAYGFAMSSTYNSRPRIAEVMVKGSKYQVIRKRETYESLMMGERGFTL